MRVGVLAAWSVVVAVAATPPWAHAADSLSGSQLSYDVAWGSTPLGDGTLTLTATGDDCYRYELKTHPIGVVRWLYGSPGEVSDFCVRDGQVVPSRMSFSNPKRPQDGFTLDFDWPHGQVLGGRNGALAIPAGTLDRLSVQQAARLWVKAHIGEANPAPVKITVVDHKRVKSYTFALKGRGSVDTPKGPLPAVRFERIDDPNTTLRFWLAPDKDYMPISVEQIEDGDAKLNLRLK